MAQPAEMISPGNKPAALADKLDRFMRDLRISVVDTCNYRCPYCMPECDFPEHHDFLPSSERLSFSEIERLARIFIGLGVEKVRVTGGEPLLRKNLAVLLKSLAEIPGLQDLALTTNGELLGRNALSLKEAGLNRITLSLDSLDEGIFKQLTGGRGHLDKVLDGIKAAEAAGFEQIKVNVVVQRGVNDQSVLQLLDSFRYTGHIVRFIEYMDVGTENHWRMQDVVSSRELKERIEARWSLKPLEENYHGEVARRYAYQDGAGEIGFISSVSEPFCGACSRARLSTDGHLYTCLFASQGLDLKTPMRAGADDDQLRQMIFDAWSGRRDRYSEMRIPLKAESNAGSKIEMYRIGG